MKVAAFHSAKRGRVYHDDDKCTTGNNIETENKRSGRGGLKHCPLCAKIQADRRKARNPKR